MKIGEKIKRLRTEKLMTQSELVGGEITRNMLSRIENGSVTPSLETVRYIASRLNVSPGFLLAEGGEEQMYFKYRELADAKQELATENFRICRDICLRSDSAEDDDMRLLLAESTLGVAAEEFAGGNLRQAAELLDEAARACFETVYRTDYVLAAVAVYFRYMRRISATISSNVIDEVAVNPYPAVTDGFCRYALWMERFGEGGDASLLDAACEEKTPFSLHCEAVRAMRDADYETAYERLHALLLHEAPIPEPMLYFVFCDLEACCREREDFRGAYEYSIDKIELLQKLLS